MLLAVAQGLRLSSRVVPRALELRVGLQAEVLRRRRADGWGALADVGHAADAEMANRRRAHA
eukprot:90443-Alexandrium_andersonii.AAC.1